MWQNSNCDKTWKLKLWQNLILRFWENSETKIVTKLKLWQISIYEEKKLKNSLLVRTFWHLDIRWDGLWAAFCESRDVFSPEVEWFS